MSDKITLTYFNFSGGRGEAARLALHLAGVEWEDNRFTGKWPDKKPTTPYGGLPVLFVPGKGELAQSNAILQYIGREHGLLPQDSWERAQHEALLNAVEELRAEANGTARDDEDEKRRAREEYAEGYFSRWAKAVNEKIKGPFFGGGAITVTDLKLYVAMRAYPKGVYDYIPTNILEPYDKITDLMAAVEAHPRIAEWLAA
jgi:glutathione S-transferase